ncbi:hypothetical protein UQ64_14415 [Paenibacillus etheri]|uniref:Diacylglycerol glucosyltransferase N-terminal domain-containing protein n=1 Tax=Paenibacillus etheri TaxID=1306852 RepID=A0A0W1AZ78_9BACL|nr:hypothetical protein UQ64_14415 [Paenibacillus etheri]
MKVVILAANTGRGHISVMNSINSFLENKACDVKLFPHFYERLMPSNKVLSDFYNLLQMTSSELCKLFTQMSLLEKPDKFNEMYSYWIEPLNLFFSNHPCDVIVSTTPLINKYIIRYLKETNSRQKFYIVVTDPFRPMYPGFAAEGADRYFCPNDETKALLEEEGIPAADIIVSGYSLHQKFDVSGNDTPEFVKQDNFCKDKPTVLINCGAQGSMHYLSIIRSVDEEFKGKANVIVLCGNNKPLYTICKNKYPRCCVLEYVDNIQDLLRISDLCITKAGANTFYECLYTDTPVLIDATKGFLYQEEGVVHFLKENNVGSIFYDLEELAAKCKEMIRPDTLLALKENISKLQITNGSVNIAEVISGSKVCIQEELGEGCWPCRL